MDVSTDGWFWVRRVGAPRKGDPRDGELHRVMTLADSFYLEPRENDLGGEDARYVRDYDRPRATDTAGPLALCLRPET